ncbi:MAG: hypothetical protein ATN33_07865 [Epulopiscium sp. Nele67-Bin001]|nr:MAG: hypothetical protein ATN33_07865 [Epulopiscium sp. Nele67-Bin001]
MRQQNSSPHDDVTLCCRKLHVVKVFQSFQPHVVAFISGWSFLSYEAKTAGCQSSCDHAVSMTTKGRPCGVAEDIGKTVLFIFIETFF